MVVMFSIGEESKYLKMQMKQNAEDRVRRNNIIIQGIDNKDAENTQKTNENIGEIFMKIGIDIELKKDTGEVKKIGRYNINVNKSILVKLGGWRRKNGNS